MIFKNKKESEKVRKVHKKKREYLIRFRSVLLVIQDGARQGPEERHLAAIQGLGVLVRAESQVGDQGEVDGEEQVGEEAGPGEDDVQDEEEGEEEAGLPCVESGKQREEFSLEREGFRCGQVGLMEREGR